MLRRPSRPLGAAIAALFVAQMVAVASGQATSDDADDRSTFALFSRFERFFCFDCL